MVMPSEMGTAVNSLNTQDMCLPSLGDLLADYPATDTDGLFSGFQSLDNRGLDLLSLPDEAATHSHQHSHQHSNHVSESTSEEHSYSAGSEGKLSTAAAEFSPHTSHPDVTAQQPQQRMLPDRQLQSSSKTTPAPAPATARIGALKTSLTTPGQDASPSLVGMTAAQVAETLGYSSIQPACPRQPEGLSRADPVSKQAPVRRQANGKKKRAREAESATPAAVSSGACEQQALSSQAAEVASRTGSPGVSSSNDASPAHTPQDHSSGHSNAGDDEEQKRMV